MGKEEKKKKRLTREQILALYQAGPEAIVSLVEYLQDEMDNLSSRVQALEVRNKKNSRNSSKPPSSDGMKKPAKQSRKSSGKKPGGQEGHEGSTLKMVETPDRIVEHTVERCGRCGSSLPEGSRIDERCRQVFDIPPITVEVTEHRSEVKQCSCCGELNEGEFPVDVTHPTQYGPRLKSIGLYLKNYALLPYERSGELLKDLFGTPISVGTLTSINHKAGDRVGEVVERIRETLTEEPVGHFDETGMRVCGKLTWLHVASSKSLTSYHTHPKRGGEAMEAGGVLPFFNGTAVHDGWKSYFAYEGCSHSLCNAHHIRELTCMYEEYGQQWAKWMIDLLLQIKKRRESCSRDSFSEEELAEFESAYRSIVQEGLQANPPPEPPKEKRRGRLKKSKPRNLLERLRDFERATLAFMYDFSVPFDNNLGERDIRMMKVQQKVSGTFRSEEGARSFCALRSYISTARKQGINVMTALEDIFTDKRLLPQISPATS
jgi:transposase